jgi:hypothetical protein
MPLQPRFRLGMYLMTDLSCIVRVIQRCPSCDRRFEVGVLNVRMRDGSASVD